jgi:glycosyltransferase involved in cell wall biosynthesis
MRISISLSRPFHSARLANALLAYSNTIEIFSSASRRFFKGLDDSVRIRLVPSPVPIAGRILHWNPPASMDRASTVFFDCSVAALIGSPDLYFGWATMCIQSARAAKRRGARFVLDRACPHLDFQQSLLKRESEKVGAAFASQPEWFRQRQLDEYELADAILVPSGYTAQSFPPHLQSKLVKAPLSGRCAYPKYLNRQHNETFTVGVVGGDPLRKGYLYLLKAWERLALPNARLLLRSGTFCDYPVLQEMLQRLDNVALVNYVPDIAEFYRSCDVFVLPSIDDGFGMALIEAIVHGCACITTTNTGASELLTHGQDALIVEPANEDQLADSILRLYESEDLRKTLAHAGRRMADSIRSSPQYSQGVASLMNKIDLPTRPKHEDCEAPSGLSRKDLRAS